MRMKIPAFCKQESSLGQVGMEVNMRILIVEDERRIAGVIARGLKEEHYAVDIANDGEQGLYLARLIRMI